MASSTFYDDILNGTDEMSDDDQPMSMQGAKQQAVEFYEAAKASALAQAPAPTPTTTADPFGPEEDEDKQLDLNAPREEEDGGNDEGGDDNSTAPSEEVRLHLVSLQKQMQDLVANAKGAVADLHVFTTKEYSAYIDDEESVPCPSTTLLIDPLLLEVTRREESIEWSRLFRE